MGFLKKHWFVLSALGIIALYFFTRLYHILALPIFTDEAIYIRWSQIASTDATWRFISLTDGKQPMFIWIAMILVKFIEDPLLAGRLVSVIAGFFSMIGMFFLGREVFRNKKIGLLSSALYVLYPFALVYDRLAIYDSLVVMFMVWALYFEILLVRHLRLDIALILGMIIGGGMLTKTSTDFAIILLPVSLLIINFRGTGWVQKTWKWIVLALVAVLIAGVMYAILRLSPFYHIIEEKNFVFIYPFDEWLMNPFAYFVGNFKGLGGWFITYMTIPFIALVAASFAIGKRYLREKLLLLAWFVIPFIALALFGRVIYPRFILFMTTPLLVLGAFTIYHLHEFIKKKIVYACLMLAFVAMFFVNDYFIVTNFARSGVPESDKEQLIAGWPSGVGIAETVAFLEEKAEKEKIYVATEGTFGLLPYALEIYLKDNPNIQIVGYWPIHDTLPEDIETISKKMPTYMVFYQPCPSCEAIGKAPPLFPVTPILSYEREDGESFYTLYEVNAEE